jgi:hypothetical protein
MGLKGQNTPEIFVEKIYSSLNRWLAGVKGISSVFRGL